MKVLWKAVAVGALVVGGCDGGDEPVPPAEPTPPETRTPAAPPPQTPPAQAPPPGAQAPDAPLVSPSLGDSTPAQAPAQGAAGERIEARALALLERRQRLDATVWAGEVRAQEYEAAIVRLWDALTDAPILERLAVLANVAFERLEIGVVVGRTEHKHGIEVTRYGGPGEGEDGGRSFTPEQWRAALGELAAGDYMLVQSAWEHTAFEDDPPRSEVAMTLYAWNAEYPRRLIIEGLLDVEWSEQRDESGHPVPRTVSARDVSVTERLGADGFRPVLILDEEVGGIPLILYDLSGNGLDDLVTGGSHSVYWNLGGGEFRRGRLLSHPEPLHRGGIIADFTGNGVADLVVAARGEEGSAGRLLLYRGEEGADPPFPHPPEEILGRGEAVMNVTAITAGDINGNGLPDLWVAQYQPPYLGGQVPTPYFDANDGFPSYLLRNDGGGRFADITEAAGLGDKRYRRTYSASLADLNDNGALDLLVVSDFAGVDLYLNDGEGRFTGASDTLAERHGFGMSHTFGDFNGDGVLDFYVVGRSSAAASRLERMGLGREGFPTYQRMRGPMSYGNRLYLGGGGGEYAVPEWNDAVARTGWSWGAASLDFDNDGSRELYVANGHITGRSAADYDSVFWRHDIYSSSSDPDPAMARVYTEALGDVRELGASWGGFQTNVLYMPDGEGSYLDVAFLFGVASEADCRGVLVADLDNNGRMDLLVPQVDYEARGHVLHVLRNEVETDHNWIGVRLREHGGGYSPLGAKVRVETAEGVRVKQIVSGDTSFSGQHSPVAHFGLGDLEEVEAIEVRWLNGEVTRVEGPAVNRYHRVDPDPE